MDPLPQPEVILTHESDLDGFVAGHLLQRLAKKLFSAEIRLEAWNTHAWRQRPLREKSAWVCDLAFESRLDKPNWLIIDHHPPLAAPAAARLIHDPQRSAALLCYDLCRLYDLQSPALTRLVTLTDVGDLFQEEHSDFHESQDYAVLAKTYPFWNLSRLLEREIERLLDHPLLEVIRTKRRVEDPIGLAWSRSRVVPLSPSIGWVDVLVGNTNLIVHELLRDPACGHAVLLTLVRKPSAGIVVSLRSRNGEALPVARKLQGGGHPNACGAILPRSVQTVPDAVEYLRRLLDPQPPGLTSLESALGAVKLDL